MRSCERVLPESQSNPSVAKLRWCFVCSRSRLVKCLAASGSFFKGEMFVQIPVWPHKQHIWMVLWSGHRCVLCLSNVLASYPVDIHSDWLIKGTQRESRTSHFTSWKLCRFLPESRQRGRGPLVFHIVPTSRSANCSSA